MVEIMDIKLIKTFGGFVFILFFSNILVEFIFEGHLGNLLNLKYLIVTVVISVFCTVFYVYAKKKNISDNQ